MPFGEGGEARAASRIEGVELQEVGSRTGADSGGGQAREREMAFEKRVDQQPLLRDAEDPARKEVVGDEFEEEGADVKSSVFNLSTTIVGAGIMALPATMRVLGLPIGLFLITVMGILSEYSVEMVVRFSSLLGSVTYEGVVGGVCGAAARAGAQICVVVNNGGMLIVYLIIIADVLSGSVDHLGLFEQWVGGPGWWNNRPLIILVVMLLVLAPLVALEHMNSLKYSSALSIGLAVLFLVLTAGVALVKLAMGEVEAPRMLPFLGSKAAIFDLFSVIPIMTNAYICHFNVPPIYHELKDKSVGKMNQVGRISLFFCTIVYGITALSGYLLFGESTAADILANFDQDLNIPYSQLINYAIRLGYAVHIMLVFPVVFFSLRLTIDAICFPKSRPLTESRTRFAVVSVILLFIVYIGSTLIPNIWIAFNFTGATTGMCLGFIFPALLVIQSNSRADYDKDKAQTYVAWFLLPLAAFVSLTGVTTQILSYV